MRDTWWYAATDLRPSADGRGAGAAAGGPALLRPVYAFPLPDPLSPRPKGARPLDRPAPRLRRAHRGPPEHNPQLVGGPGHRRRPSRPRTVRAAFDAPRAEQLRALLPQRPRAVGKATGIWTLDLAAEVSFEPGLTPERVSGETIRATLARLGLKWKRG